jgi:hypothetical protein
MGNGAMPIGPKQPCPSSTLHTSSGADVNPNTALTALDFRKRADRGTMCLLVVGGVRLKGVAALNLADFSEGLTPAAQPDNKRENFWNANA